MLFQPSIRLLLSALFHSLAVSVITAFAPSLRIHSARLWCGVEKPSVHLLTCLSSAKTDFLQSLSRYDTLNEGTRQRTQLLNRLIALKQETDVQTIIHQQPQQHQDEAWSVRNPASLSSMLPIAPGTWKVIYAPHMSTIAKLAGNLALDVTYILHSNQTIVSHATFGNLPVLHLSVSGTYNSVSDSVCSVEWTETWIKASMNTIDDDLPYPTIHHVPDSWLKTAIARVGRLLFIRPFSLFPVSYLSKDMTVFDFDLLGTRICAKKQNNTVFLQ